MTILEYLKSQDIDKETIKKIIEFRQQYEIKDLALHPRFVTNISDLFIGSKVLKTAIYAILAGKHVIFEGVKGSGKNTLVEVLANIFQRPIYEYPFNGNTDVSNIVGENTLISEDGASKVVFQEHQLLQAMKDPFGAWFVGDEVNMAKAEVLSVLHAVTDNRRRLDVPGYGIVEAHPAFRFIGTMNYGYMGTQELNEAFADRFVVISVPPIEAEALTNKMSQEYPELKTQALDLCSKLYHDLHKLALDGEISSRAVSLRGVLDAVKLIKNGLPQTLAFESCVVSKAFESLEKDKVRDVISTRLGDNDVTTVWFKTVPVKSEVVSGVDISSVTEAVNTTTKTKKKGV